MKKHSFLKDLVFIFIIVAIIAKVDDYCSKYDYDIYKFADEYDREHKLGDYSENTTDVEGNNDEYHIEDDSENKNSEVYNSAEVYVHGLGDFTQSDLEVVRRGVEEFYGMKTVIGSNYTPNRDLFNGQYFMAHNFLMSDISNGSGYHIYVTNYPMCVSNESVSLISGRARHYQKNSVISTYQMTQNGHYSNNSLIHTATHEIAHNFGLDHCDNDNCLMKSHGLDTRELCNNCKMQLKN